jgi:hypothetical protein
MRKLLLAFLFSGTLAAHGSTTFPVERLSKPTSLIRQTAADRAFQNLVFSESDYFDRNLSVEKMNDLSGIVAKSKTADSLVYLGQHAFFQGMYRAYADHRPFVLSPDMIWLLISQGFAQHVNNNAEQLRHFFVDFSGKTTLMIRDDRIRLDDPYSPWETVFSDFTRQIDAVVGKNLVQTLSCDFSTTTPTTLVATQITVMEAMKAYFDFIVIRVGCGIPEITLEGTPDDWRKLLVKVEYLRKYELDWWVDELVPLLKGFVKASEGKVDTDFWKAMFKYHTLKKYGAPEIIDGWIVTFFPYDKDGKRNNLKELAGTEKLTKELVKVPLDYVELQPNGKSVKVPLEIWAGFIGLRQNETDFSLRPEIGWLVRKRATYDPVLLEKFKKTNLESRGRISLRLKTIPSELIQLKTIGDLSIEFTGPIVLPDDFNDLTITNLKLSGSISPEESDRIAAKLTHTNTVIINGKTYIGGRALK